MKRQLALLALVTMAFFCFTMGIAEAQETDVQPIEQINELQPSDDSAYPDRLIDVSIGASVQLYAGFWPSSINADVLVQYRFNSWYRLGIRWNAGYASNLKGDFSLMTNIEGSTYYDDDYDAFSTSFIIVNEFDVYNGNIFSFSIAPEVGYRMIRKTVDLYPDKPVITDHTVTFGLDLGLSFRVADVLSLRLGLGWREVYSFEPSLRLVFHLGDKI